MRVYWAWVNDGGEAGIGFDERRKGRGYLHPTLATLTRISFSRGSGIDCVPRTTRWLIASTNRAYRDIFKCRLPFDLFQGRRIFKYLLLERGKVLVVQILDHRTESRFSE